MHKSNLTHSQAISATIVFYLAFILLGLTTAVTGPTLPALAERTSSRIDQISFIFITGSLGYLIGSWIGGRAYDRLPGNRIVPGALICLAIASALIPTTSLLLVLTFFIFLLGFSQGIIDVGGNTLLFWIHSDAVGPFMNGLHFFFGIGALLSPIIVAQVVQFTGDIKWIYWLFSLVAVPVAIWAWFNENPLRPEKITAQSKPKVNKIAVALVMISFFLYVGAEIGYGNWIFTYTTAMALATTAGAAYLTSAFWGAFTLGRLAGIPISTRVSSQKILFWDLIGCIASVGLIIAGAESATFLWLGTILLGLSMASIFPSLMTFADSKLHLSGEITGLFLVGAGLGGMFLPWLIGQAFASAGPQSMPILIFIDLVATLMILIVLVARLFNFEKVKDAG